MPTRVPWDPSFIVGHELIDAQHQALLSQCNLLADCCRDGQGDEADQQFDQGFERLRAMAREHFEAEATLLSSRGYADLEDHQLDCDEFEYLADEIVTTEHFDRLELQRFLALWWLGHITGSAEPLRACLADAGSGD